MRNVMIPAVLVVFLLTACRSEETHIDTSTTGTVVGTDTALQPIPPIDTAMQPMPTDTSLQPVYPADTALQPVPTSTASQPVTTGTAPPPVRTATPAPAVQQPAPTAVATPTPAPAATPRPAATATPAPTAAPATPSTPAASGAKPPKTHTVDHGGAMHAPGGENPLQRCAACHGKELKGGKAAKTSCYDCHEKVW